MEKTEGKGHEGQKKKWGRKRRESLLGLIRVIIGGQSMQRQLEAVNVTRREVDGEEWGCWGETWEGSANNAYTFPPHKGDAG